MGEEASANVDSQKKNNLSVDDSNRGFLPHNYPNKMRMLKNYGSGGMWNNNGYCLLCLIRHHDHYIYHLSIIFV